MTRRQSANYVTAIGLLLIGSVAAMAQLPKPGELPPTPPKPGQIGRPPQTAPPASSTNNPQPTGNTPVDQSANQPTFVTGVTRIFVPTSVTDKKTGNYIDGLTTKDFTLYDNGEPQKIESDLIDQPISVVLVVQANSDVEPVIPKLRKAGVLIQGLVTGQDGDVAVLAFDHRMQHIQDFTNDPQKLDDAMQKITSGSSTAALIDAVLEADHMLQARDPQKQRHRVILLLSRNVDKGSEAHLEETVRKMQFDDITVYCVDISKALTAFLKKPDYPRPANGGIPAASLPNMRGNGAYSDTDVVRQQDGNLLNGIPPIYRSIRDLFKKTPAEAFTQFTGGRIYNFATEKGLEQAITDIGKNLNSEYVLTYSPNNSREPGFHTIRVEVNRLDLNVDTRPGYWAMGGIH